MTIKEVGKKFWFLLWKDDSLKGWIFSLVFLFVFIKFIFFPGLSLVTGTPLPLAIVESCSMYHESFSFNTWYETHESKYSNFGFSKEQFQEFTMKKGFNKGDILFIIGTNPDKLKVGDIIIFNANQQNPIIHRIIKITTNTDGEKIFSTIGDNNNGQLGVEREIRKNQIVGKAVVNVIPYAGWAKLIFYERARPESERGFCKEN